MKLKHYSLVFILTLMSSFGAQSQIETDSLLSISTGNTHIKFQIHFYEAIKQKALENYSKAIEELLECKDLNPEESVVFYELGTNYFKLDQFEDAESNFKKAIALNGSNFWYKESLYYLYVDTARYEQAISAVQPLLSRSSDYEQDLANLYINL